MKVIFLDIDGVLNASNDFGGRRKPNPMVTADSGIRYCGISATKVKELAWLVAETGAKIVLVSSWKDDYEEYLADHMNKVGKYLRNKLRKQGLSIFDTTCRFSYGVHSYRGTEIKRWLAEAAESIESWVVLDDEVFSDYDDDINSHLVQTSETDGLTRFLAKQAACKLLNLEDGALDDPWEQVCREVLSKIMPNVEEQELVVVKPAGPANKIDE